MVKILYVGVFDKTFKSTNTSQLLSLRRAGHQVTGYNFRKKAQELGMQNRDNDLIQFVKKANFDLVIYSKCNQVSYGVFSEIGKMTKTCLWFMDPLCTYSEEMKRKTSLVDYFCCDKKNVLEKALQINKKSFYVCEGFFKDIDRPHDLKKENDVSFVGNLYGSRQSFLNNIKYPVKVVNNAYAHKHAQVVSRSKINLNFCTAAGASDRVYKIAASRGFLLTDEWYGRRDYFIDGKNCAIFSNLQDLNEKIKFYLENDDVRERIAQNAFDTVNNHNLTRLSWANKIVEPYLRGIV